MQPRTAATLSPLLAGALLLGGADLMAQKPAPWGEKEAWETPEAGLARVRAEKKPVFLVAPGREAESLLAELEDGLLASSSVRRQLRAYVAILLRETRPKAPGGKEKQTHSRTEPPRPDPRELLTRGLGVVGTEPLIALLDFRGAVLWRRDGDLPQRTKLLRALKRARARNDDLARRFSEAGEALARGAYALKLKRTREGVKWLLKARAVKLPPGSEPAEMRQRLEKEIEGLFREEEEKARKLGEAGDYPGAIQGYENLLKRFPLPEVEKELRRKIADLLQKLRGLGPGGW